MIEIDRQLTLLFPGDCMPQWQTKLCIDKEVSTQGGVLSLMNKFHVIDLVHRLVRMLIWTSAF